MKGWAAYIEILRIRAMHDERSEINQRGTGAAIEAQRGSPKDPQRAFD